MRTMLFIDHDYHKKTQSSLFLKQILQENFELEEFNYNPYAHNEIEYKKVSNKKFDILVCFQIMPSIKKLKKIIDFKSIVLFPMYDASPNRNDLIWEEYKDALVINFSKTLHKELDGLGFISKYIQYFPKPFVINDWGGVKNLLFFGIERKE